MIMHQGRPLAERDAPTILAFCAWMSACVSKRRGGRNSDWIRECADFVADVVGRRLSISDPLPAEYDWRPSAAIDLADTMMEYDA